MTDNELSAIVADVVRRYGVPPLAEGEFTCQMFADTNGTSYNVAKKVIARAIAAGAIVAVGMRSCNQRFSQAYRMAEDVGKK